MRYAIKEKNLAVKILIVLLTIALCVSNLGLPAFAQEENSTNTGEAVQLSKLEVKVLNYDPNGQILENFNFNSGTTTYQLKLNKAAQYGVQVVIGTKEANPNVEEVTCTYTNKFDYTPEPQVFVFGDTIGGWDNQITSLAENAVTPLTIKVKATAASGLTDNTYIINLTKGTLPGDMTAEYVAQNELGAVQMPTQDQVVLPMPTVPTGFTVTIATSGDETILHLDGTIVPPQVERIIPVTFRVTKGADVAVVPSVDVTVPSKSLGEPLGKVTLAAEKFLDGAGYDQEPCQAAFYTNDNGYYLLQRLVGGDKKIAAYIDGKWSLLVNNQLKTDFAAYVPANGDVIRFQSTVAGNVDTAVNRDALTQEIGRINSLSNKTEYLKTDGVQEKYDAALLAVKDLTKNQTEIDAVCQQLVNVLTGKLTAIAAGIQSAALGTVAVNQETLPMPTVPSGYTIAVDESTVSPVGAIGANGNLILPDQAVQATLQLKITESATGQTANTATLAVAIPPSSYENGDLKILQLADYSDQELTLTSTATDGSSKTGFFSNITHYTVDITEHQATNQNRIEWKATAAKPGTTITMQYTNGSGEKKIVNVESANSGWSYNTPDSNYIFGGDNTIEFVVTPPQGTAKTYTVTVKKPLADGTNGLSKLELLCGSDSELIKFSQLDKDGVLYQGSGDNLNEGFVTEIKEYTTSVNNSVAKIKIKAQGAEGNIGFKLGEANFSGGATSNAIPLQVGLNEIKVEATRNGSVFATYLLKVTRLPELSFDAITITPGSVEKPTDAPGYRSIVASIPKTASSYDLTMTVQDGIAITVDGVPVFSAQPLTINYQFSTTPDVKKIVLTKTVNGQKITSSYTLQVYGKEQGAPDRVYSYLPAPGQFTNDKTYGIFSGLSGRGVVDTSNIGGLVSLGSFGGAVTYKFDEGITNNKANQFGIDFIVYGNAFYNNSEPAAVYVAKKNAAGQPDKWYALAGSEHYEDSTDWNYTVSYTNPDPQYLQNKASDISWEDNRGHQGVIKAGGFHSQPYYPQATIFGQQGNPTHSDEKMTVSGINLGVTRNGAFGYADVHPNNFGGDYNKPVNPYALNFTDMQSAQAHRGDGMDISWAVDEHGKPVQLGEINFVKVVNATLLSLGMMGDVSAEISAVRAVNPEAQEVGVTTDLAGISIKNADGSGQEQKILLQPGQTEYEVQLGNKEYVTVTPQGVGNENIYVNNEKLLYNSGQKVFQTSKAYQVTKDSPKLVRVIAQTGEQEPIIYLLKLIGTAEKSTALLTSIDVDCYGAIRQAVKNSDHDYSIKVGSAISAVKLAPHAQPGTTVSINNQVVLAGEYSGNLSLQVGNNTFTVKTVKGEQKETAVLTVVRESSSVVDPEKKISVSLRLLGDTKHGQIAAPHVYVKDYNRLSVWINTVKYTVSSGSTVKDVLEKALADAGMSYVNQDGNYVSAITAPSNYGSYSLAEMDNGPLSGWMYLLNGKHPTLGLAEQVLSDGDVVLWHYTDDYTQEDGAVQFPNGGSGTGSTDSKKPVVKPNDKNKVVFADVAATYWAVQYIQDLVAKQLLTGKTATLFAPNDSISRAELVTILARLSGEQLPAYNSNFTDVTAADWFAGNIAWAVKAGITNGDDGKFRPNAPISREEIAVMLSRYVKYKKLNLSLSQQAVAFADQAQIAEFAEAAVIQMQQAGIISGKANNLFAPADDATRAEAAKMISILLQQLTK